jgi:hypothetical protein
MRATPNSSSDPQDGDPGPDQRHPATDEAATDEGVAGQQSEAAQGDDT